MLVFAILHIMQWSLLNSKWSVMHRHVSQLCMLEPCTSACVCLYCVVSVSFGIPAFHLNRHKVIFSSLKPFFVLKMKRQLLYVPVCFTSAVSLIQHGGLMIV